MLQRRASRHQLAFQLGPKRVLREFDVPSDELVSGVADGVHVLGGFLCLAALVNGEKHRSDRAQEEEHDHGVRRDFSRFAASASATSSSRSSLSTIATSLPRFAMISPSSLGAPATASSNSAIIGVGGGHTDASDLPQSLHWSPHQRAASLARERTAACWQVPNRWRCDTDVNESTRVGSALPLLFVSTADGPRR
jgi:hypothetical protein